MNMNKPYFLDDYIAAMLLGFDLNNDKDYETYFELSIEEEDA